MKKFIALVLAACIAVTLLPAQQIYAYAETVTTSGMLMESELIVRDAYAASVTGWPVLAEGEYERWIDRIGNLPDFAEEFYGWLEENASATGALADPSKGSTVGGAQVQLIESVTGTARFSYQNGESVSQKAYEAAVADLGNLPYIIADYIFAAYAAFDRDHPEVFWLTGASSCSSSISYNYTQGGGSGIVEYTLNLYFYLKNDKFDLRAAAYQDVAAIATAVEQREAHIQRILEGYPYEGNILQQVQYLNDALTKTNAYNSAVVAGDYEAAAPTAWECISALSGSVGTEGPVCEGYARAFNVLCDRVGIPCVLVEGTGNAAAHMWNYVQMDQQWYAVDVTFNDPVDYDAPDAVVSGEENNQWTGLGTSSQTPLGIPFDQSHIVENVSYNGGLEYTNGPALSKVGYTSDCMDIAPYRSEQGYTAPEREGYIFAGWYTDAELTQPLPKNQTTGWAYAKFVDANVLTLKLQTTYGTNADSPSTDLRLLTSVADLELNSVSFAVTLGDVTQNLSSRTVYEKIKAGDAVISNAAEVFGEDSAYFVTYQLLGVPQAVFDAVFTVVPCWQTMDGTFVEGTARSFTISQTY